MLSQLQEKHDDMITLYNQHCQTVYELQEFLEREALAELTQELSREGICSSDIEPWLYDWVDDCGSIFRMLKKHRFDIEGTKSALKRTLRWRLSELPELLDPELSTPFIKCLPPSVHDIFGRPVILFQLQQLNDASSISKSYIVDAYENIRRQLHLKKHDGPSLQFVMIIDAKDISMRSMTIDLISWFVKEVAPQFPGMCAAAFVINYSWAYGMYNIIKRLLPANVLARIHFPTQAEFYECFKKECLPHEYGGELNLSNASMTIDRPEPSHGSGDIPIPYEQLHRHTPSTVLPSMSALNPYYGYPIISSPGSFVPRLKNGRRRKRDLARTLFRLWLVKLKKWTDKTWLWIVISIALWVAGVK